LRKKRGRAVAAAKAGQKGGGLENALDKDGEVKE
jgi:hypothetical protein